MIQVLFLKDTLKLVVKGLMLNHEIKKFTEFQIIEYKDMYEKCNN